MPPVPERLGVAMHLATLQLPCLTLPALCSDRRCSTRVARTLWPAARLPPCQVCFTAEVLHAHRIVVMAWCDYWN